MFETYNTKPITNLLLYTYLQNTFKTPSNKAFTATDENESVYSVRPTYVPSVRMTKKGQALADKARSDEEAHSQRVRSRFQQAYARVRVKLMAASAFMQVSGVS